jgi:Holliday junction resolvase RusA-like endonuclease
MNDLKIIRFYVEGIPAPGGSKNAFALKKHGRYTGRVALVDAGGTGNKMWRAAVREAGMKAMAEAQLAPLEGPLQLTVHFWMPRPKWHYTNVTKKNPVRALRSDVPTMHTFKPDVTKILRSTEDALTQVAWVDDSQICAQTAFKSYSVTPGAWIIIMQLNAFPT